MDVPSQSDVTGSSSMQIAKSLSYFKERAVLSYSISDKSLDIGGAGGTNTTKYFWLSPCLSKIKLYEEVAI